MKTHLFLKIKPTLDILEKKLAVILKHLPTKEIFSMPAVMSCATSLRLWLRLSVVGVGSALMLDLQLQHIPVAK